MSDFLPKELKKAIDKAGKQAVIDGIKNALKQPIILIKELKPH